MAGISMNLIAENWALSGSPDYWVVVNGIPGEMNYGNMIANGFRSQEEALEFIRLAQTKDQPLWESGVSPMPPRLRVIKGGRK